MNKQYELMLYISVLEDAIAPQMKAFEDAVRNRWRTLPSIQRNTVYHMCPYFGHLNDEIESFFETGIMRIAHNASREYSSFSGNKLELSWFGVNGNYSELLEDYCTPFVDAFEAASSGGLARLKQARRELESNTSGRRYGYITNSFTYMLAVETITAISSAMRAVEQDNQAWKMATAPQQAMHDKLVSLWSKNFEAVFMKQVEEQNILVTKEIIESMCLASRFTYEMYADAKSSSSFSKDKENLVAARNAASKLRASKKRITLEKIIAELQAEVDAIDVKLKSLGFALWGEKRKERKELEQERNRLSMEINATAKTQQLPSTYIFTLPHTSPAYKKFANTLFNSDFFTKDWKFVYDSKEKGYIAVTPEDESLFVVKGRFLTLYGHGRALGGRWEDFLPEAATATVTQVQFSIFEIKE